MVPTRVIADVESPHDHCGFLSHYETKRVRLIDWLRRVNIRARARAKPVAPPVIETLWILTLTEGFGAGA